MNTTVLVALITGLSAIVPNIIITILNNRHNLNYKNLKSMRLQNVMQL